LKVLTPGQYVHQVRGQNKKGGEDTLKKRKVEDPRYSTDELDILVVQSEKDIVAAIPCELVFSKFNGGQYLG
jgi:hypothetical protein